MNSKIIYLNKEKSNKAEFRWEGDYEHLTVLEDGKVVQSEIPMPSLEYGHYVELENDHYLFIQVNKFFGGKRSIYFMLNGKRYKEENLDSKDKIQTVKFTPRLFYWLADMLIFSLIIIFSHYTFEMNFLSLYVYVIFFFYYFIFEALFAQTPGKMFARVYVIEDDGTNPSTLLVALRTLIRLIPLELFSCMARRSRGWHDKWANTYVVEKSVKEKLLEKSSYSINEKSYSKAVILFLILSMIFYLGYRGSKYLAEADSLDAVFLDENLEHLNSIVGIWKTDWNDINLIEFNNEHSVVLTNTNSDRSDYEYHIYNDVLYLKSSDGLKSDYLIMEITNKKMVWMDLKNGNKNIIFHKLN